MHVPMNSDQLKLTLEDVRAPWGGLSPRELTRAFEMFSVDASPAGGPIPGVSKKGQLELFPEEKSDGS